MGRTARAALVLSVVCCAQVRAGQTADRIEHPMDVLENALSGADFLDEQTKDRYRRIVRDRLEAEGAPLSLEELSDAAVGGPVDAETLEKAKVSTRGLYGWPRDVWRPGQGVLSVEFVESVRVVDALRKRRPEGLPTGVPYAAMSQWRKNALNDYIRAIPAHHDSYRREDAYSQTIRDSVVEGFRMELYRYFDWPVFDAENPDEIERQVTELARLNAELRGREFPPKPIDISGATTAYDWQDIAPEPIITMIENDMTPSMKHPLEPAEYDQLLQMVREKAQSGQPWESRPAIATFYDEHTLEKHYGHLDPSVFILWAGVPQDEFDAFNALRFRAFEERIRMQRQKQERERLERLAGELKGEAYEAVADLLDMRQQAEVRPTGAVDGGGETPAPEASSPVAAAQPEPRPSASLWWAAAGVLAFAALIAAAALACAHRKGRSD